MAEAVNPEVKEQAPSGRVHPLVRPSAVGWWWVFHCGRWRCGRV